MNWHIRVSGLRPTVRNQVIACFDMPAGVRETILQILDDPEASRMGNDSAFVEGAGVVGGGSGCIQTLRVLLFVSAKPKRVLSEILPT